LILKKEQNRVSKYKVKSNIKTKVRDSKTTIISNQQNFKQRRWKWIKCVPNVIFRKWLDQIIKSINNSRINFSLRRVPLSIWFLFTWYYSEIIQNCRLTWKQIFILCFRFFEVCKITRLIVPISLILSENRFVNFFLYFRNLIN
jgi:hypothetical protein